MYFPAFGVRAIPSARDSRVLLRVLVVLDKQIPLNWFHWIVSDLQPLSPNNLEILAGSQLLVTPPLVAAGSLGSAPAGSFHSLCRLVRTGLWHPSSADGLCRQGCRAGRRIPLHR